MCIRDSTQNVKDLLSSREVENIFENSDFVYKMCIRDRHRWAANDKKGAVKQGIPDYTCMEGESL